MTGPSLSARAQSWIACSKPSAVELCKAHNSLVMRVRAGIEAAAAAEPALDALGEAFVDAGGDPVDLLDLDQIDQPAIADVSSYPQSGNSHLCDYSSPAVPTALVGEAKRQAFQKLRAKLENQSCQ